MPHAFSPLVPYSHHFERIIGVGQSNGWTGLQLEIADVIL